MSEFLYHPDNIDLLQDYVDASETDNEKNLKLKLISSVTQRRSSQFIIDKIKPLYTESNDRLFLSCLASSYSSEDKTVIFPKMGITDVDNKISRFMEEIPLAVKPKRVHILKTLGLNVE